MLIPDVAAVDGKHPPPEFLARFPHVGDDLACDLGFEHQVEVELGIVEALLFVDRNLLRYVIDRQEVEVSRLKGDVLVAVVSGRVSLAKRGDEVRAVSGDAMPSQTVHKLLLAFVRSRRSAASSTKSWNPLTWWSYRGYVPGPVSRGSAKW